MKPITKVIIGAGTVAGVYAIYRIYQIQTVGSSLETNLIPHINLKTFKITTDLVIKNPKNASIEITRPYCKLIMGGKEVAHTAVSDEKIKVAKLSQTVIPNLNFSLDWLGVIAAIPTFAIAIVTSGAKAAFNNTKPRIDYSLYANGFEVKDSQPLTA